MKRCRYKRFFDIVFISCSCVLGLPILVLVVLIVSIAIKIDNYGPIFYKQTRLSKHGKEFQIIKFRTMIVDAEKTSGACLVKVCDSRITRVGKILRITRLDELPQLINILHGEMSLVGPRPERPEIIKIIKKTVPSYDNRLNVLPGMTGFAQIYNPDNTNFALKLKYDRVYMQNMCLWLDIRLIVLSIFKVLSIK